MVQKRWQQYPDAIRTARKPTAHHSELGFSRQNCTRAFAKQKAREQPSFMPRRLNLRHFSTLAGSLTWFLQLVRVVGGGKTRNKSLFSGQTVVLIAAAYEAAGTNRYDEIRSPGKGLRSVTRWIMDKKLLSQFRLRKNRRIISKGD